MIQSPSLPFTLTLAVSVGVLVQAISERARIPAIVPLLLAGIALGPAGAGWIDPSRLGAGLPVLVNFSIAVILFEGALNLDLGSLRHLQRHVARLLSLGALITWAGGALAARILAGLPWNLSILFGALVIVTGPTVIHPLLARVPIRPHLRRILESEGVLIDPIGVLVAAVAMDLLFLGGGPALGGPLQFVLRLAAGALAGGAMGAMLVVAARRGIAGGEETQVLIFLAGALAAFGFSQAVVHGSGLVAVTAAGVVVGNARVPHLAEIRRFKGQLTVLVIGVLFVLLAATLDLGAIRGLGARGIAVVAVLLLVVRPLGIFLCMAGSGLPIREKLFLSGVAPRGIVAASVTSLLALRLREMGVAGAGAMEGLAYLTIALSVIATGMTARPLSRLLGVAAERTGVVILGASPLARVLGLVLKEGGREVGLIDANERHCTNARARGLPALEGNGLDRETLERAGLHGAGTFVSLTTNEAVNVLACAIAREEFQVGERIVLLTESAKGVEQDELARVGARAAFGGKQDLSLWDDRIRRGEVGLVTIRWEGASGTRLEDAGIPGEALPLAIRNARIVRVARGGLTFDPGDELIALAGKGIRIEAWPGTLVGTAKATA